MAVTVTLLAVVLVVPVQEAILGHLPLWAVWAVGATALAVLLTATGRAMLVPQTWVAAVAAPVLKLRLGPLAQTAAVALLCCDA